MKNKTITSKVAYLIGIDDNTLFRDFYENVYGGLYEKQEANLINLLCKMRTNLMSHYFDNGFEFAAQSVFVSYVVRLNKLGIKLNTELQTNFEYLKQINNLINENINKCAAFFVDDDVDWLRIRNYIVFPDFKSKENTETTIEYFCNNRGFYPYGCYVNYKQKKQGNMLSFDELFLNLVGENRRKKEQNSPTYRRYIETFLIKNGATDVLVDCENTDPFKFFLYLNGLKGECKDELQCIYLISDSRASAAWKYVPEHFKNLRFEFSEISRIKSSKSLVDENLMIVISKLYFEKRQKSFVIFSSDSDFMALIDLFPNAELFFVCDKSKTANRTISYLKYQKTSYEFFCNKECAELEKFKFDVIKAEFKDFLTSNFSADLNEILQNILFNCHLDLSNNELQSTINELVYSTTVIHNEDNILTFFIE